MISESIRPPIIKKVFPVLPSGTNYGQSVGREIWFSFICFKLYIIGSYKRYRSGGGGCFLDAWGGGGVSILTY